MSDWKQTFNTNDGIYGKYGKITLNKIKKWASGDDVATCDVSKLISLASAFGNKSSFVINCKKDRFYKI